MESLESQARRAEKAKEMWTEEQAGDAWYVSLWGFLFGFEGAVARRLQQRARDRRHAA